MRRALSLLFLSALWVPAQDLPPEVLTLARIHDRVREAVERLPDCTCVETVARFRKSAGQQLKPVDRVVLQILFSGGKELYASPGDTHWETNPFTFVASGMISNGLFALNLKTIFLNNHSIIRYKGEESPVWHRETRYDFQISRMSSGYTVQRAGASGAAAMRGSFWADPETYDLLRLEFHAEEIPPELLYADISTTIDYNRVRIGASDILLPQTADVRTTGVDGEENRNHIEFTHCQGFRAESTLAFGAARDDAPAAGPAATLPQPAKAEGTLPPALRIVIALSTPIDERAAVGSLVQGKVVGSVMHKGEGAGSRRCAGHGPHPPPGALFRRRRLFHRGFGIHTPRNAWRKLCASTRTCRMSTAATAPRWCSAATRAWSRAGSGPRHGTTPTASGSGRTKCPAWERSSSAAPVFLCRPVSRQSGRRSFTRCRPR